MTFYRIVSLPDQWPGVDANRQPTAVRPKAPFRAGWQDTMTLLEGEVQHLKGREVTLALEVDARDLNKDGGIRADARIRSSDVVLSLVSNDARLTFPCDAFDWWQSNVRAIALALGDLRRVDRYRVNAGRQYEGFKALGSGGPAAPKVGTLSPQAAAEVLAKYCELPAVLIHADIRVFRVAARLAKAAAHPDKGGTGDAFAEVIVAIQVLEAHHAD